MKFVRDILVVHIQTTGPSTERDFPIQIAGVLIDKDNLLEKQSFSSFVRHPFSQTTNDKIVQMLGIQKENLLRAPKLADVIDAFKAKFPYSVTVAAHNYASIEFLRDSFKRTSKAYEYDTHVMDLWTLGYWFMCRQGIKKIPTADTLAVYLKLSRENENDALANARFSAEVLRRLTKNA